MIKHIFFDLDNTLWDYRKNSHITLINLYEKERIFENFNINFDDFYKEYYKNNEILWEKIRDGEIDKNYLRKHRFYDTFLHFGIDDSRLAADFETRFVEEVTDSNELVEGAMEVLNYLKNRGYHLHVISNGFAEVTQKKIENSGLNVFLETVVSADEIGVRKPNPKIFEYSLENAGAEKNESILIGDDYTADCKGAEGFGMDVIFFDSLNENPKNENFKIIKKLPEIMNFL